jgi:outer membrane protein assembly factor BamB
MKPDICVSRECGVLLLLSIPLLLSPASGWAADWRQFRGPNQDGTSPESILKTWPANGPSQLWKVPLTNGFSVFAVSEGRVFSQITRRIAGQSREVCVALNATNGAELWASPVGPASYPDGGAGSDDGPRSTPAVQADRVYVLNSYLGLYCLNPANGATNWFRDLSAEYGGQVISWQNAASPVLDGDLLFVNVNSAENSLLALDTSDGRLVWRSETGATNGMTHASPVVTTIEGVRQVIFLTQSGLVSLDRQTGQLLWIYRFTYNGTSAAASPVVYSNMVFCSAAYGSGAAAVRVSFNNSVWSLAQLWRNSLQSHWMTPVSYQGALYGQFGSYSASAPLKCVDLATGRERWSTNNFGCGGTILADGHLLVLKESGQLVLVRPATNAYLEVAKFQAVSGKCWSIPVLSGGRLYVRSTQQAASFDVSLPPPPALKWLAPQVVGSRLLLQASGLDGSPVDSNRLARIRVLATGDPSLGLGSWSTVSNALVWSNGLLRLNIPDANSAPRRFFVTEEQP